MEKVILVGDSIRMGYDRYVRDHLSGEAEVYYPGDNCRFALYVLRHFPEWVEKECDPASVTVVHWNAGAWDCIRLFGDDPFTPIDQYADALRRVHKRIKMLCPNAVQIFANCVATVESRYTNPERGMRYNADIERYNDAAKQVMGELGVRINDLHHITLGLPECAWSDGAHLYTEMGTRALGDAVCAAVRSAFRT